MNDLKKYAAIGGGVVMMACWPLVVGQIGEKLATNNISRLSNATLSTELVSYDRGYLSSQADIRVSVIDPTLKREMEADGLQTSWRLESEIQHSLWTVNTVTHLPDYPQLPFAITSRTQLNGDSHVVASMGEYQSPVAGSPAGWQLVAQPSELIFDVTLQQMMSAELSIPKVHLSNQQGDYLNIQQLTSKVDGQVTDGLWVGEQSFVLGGIELGSPSADSIYLIDGLSYNMNSQLSSSAANQSQDNASPSSMSSSYSSQSLLNVKKVIVAEQQIDDLVFRINAGDIDAQHFANLVSVLQYDDLASELAERQIVEAVDGLFNHGFYVHVEKVGLSYLNQPISGEFVFNFLAQKGSVSQNPMQITQNIDGDIVVTVPKTLAQQVPNLQRTIDQLQAKEYITQTETDFEFVAKLEDGNLLFSNGEKLPIIAALMPLFLR